MFSYERTLSCSFLVYFNIQCIDYEDGFLFVSFYTNHLFTIHSLLFRVIRGSVLKAFFIYIIHIVIYRDCTCDFIYLVSLNNYNSLTVLKCLRLISSLLLKNDACFLEKCSLIKSPTSSSRFFVFLLGGTGGGNLSILSFFIHPVKRI